MIDYKDAAELRELLKLLAPPLLPAPTRFNAEIRAMIHEALPYWIDKAEAAERAVERLLDALDHGARCPQAGMWDECRDYGDAKCRACRKAWAMKAKGE